MNNLPIDNFEYTIDRVDELAPLVWAYVGDSLFDLKIRQRIVENTNSKPHQLHLKMSKIVNAKRQAKIFIELENNNILTSKELQIAKRARNSKNYHLPKNTSPIEYALSSGLEALFGYLQLKGNTKRIEIIINEVFKILEI